MADFLSAFFSRAVADPTVSGIIGTRAYPVIRPQGSALPCIRYQVISDPRRQHLKGYSATRVTGLQVDCMAESYEESKVLAEAIVTLMEQPDTVDGIRFGHSSADGPRDLGEETVEGFVHNASVDLLVEHN